MAWYEIRQTVPEEGEVAYSEGYGYSARLFLEAPTREFAWLRVLAIAVYPQEFSASSPEKVNASGRWEERKLHEVAPLALPQEGGALVLLEGGDQQGKLLPEGVPDSFVHPLHSSFYGSHGTTERRRWRGEGYGLTFTLTSPKKQVTTVGEVERVSREGLPRGGGKGEIYPTPSVPHLRTSSQELLLYPPLRMLCVEGISSGREQYLLWAPAPHLLTKARAHLQRTKETGAPFFGGYQLLEDCLGLQEAKEPHPG